MEHAEQSKDNTSRPLANFVRRGGYGATAVIVFCDDNGSSVEVEPERTGI